MGSCGTQHHSITLMMTFLLLSAHLSSSTIAAFSIVELLFPKVNVTMMNTRDTPVQYLCSFSGDQQLHQLQPGHLVWWSFSQIFAPIYWCYIYVKPDVQGFFWGYSSRYGCKNCNWEFRKEDPFVYLPELEKKNLVFWLAKDLASSGQKVNCTLRRSSN